MSGFSADYILPKSMMAFILFAALSALLCKSPTAVRADSLCDALISPLGYPCNAYTADTPDGFILGIYNIPYGRAGPGTSAGPPVLLFHGYEAGGDNFVANSAEQSLGTVLADAGFDVWIGNNRNVQWSSGSSKYSESDKAYWDWTWDELGAYDVPASIEFVYNNRGGAKVFYVGHSQGTTTLIAALTSDTTLKAKVVSQLRAAVLLAPITYNSNIIAPLQKILLQTYSDEILPTLGVGPLNVKSLITTICNTTQQGCNDTLKGLLGQDSFINETRKPIYLQYFPQLTSTENLNHFGQTFRSGIFQKYDRGPIGNLLEYGQLSPPLYDLSSFPTSLPIQVFTGGIDGLADSNDIQHTLAALPSSAWEVITLTNYGHLDFVIGFQAHRDVYPQILSFFQRN